MTEILHPFVEAERRAAANRAVHQQGREAIAKALATGESTDAALGHYVTFAEQIVPSSVTRWARRTHRNVRGAILEEAVDVFFKGDLRIAKGQK